MINKFLKSDKAFFLMLSALAVIITSILPESAHAQPAADDVPIFAATICNIIGTLQGDVVRAIAAFGVIFLGFSLFLGKITWGVALAIGIGLGAVLGAEEIVNVMGAGDPADDLDCEAAITAAGP